MRKEVITYESRRIWTTMAIINPKKGGMSTGLYLAASSRSSFCQDSSKWKLRKCHLYTPHHSWHPLYILKNCWRETVFIFWNCQIWCTPNMIHENSPWERLSRSLHQRSAFMSPPKSSLSLFILAYWFESCILINVECRTLDLSKQ